MFRGSSNIKLSVNLFIVSQVVACGQIDGHHDTKRHILHRFILKVLKMVVTEMHNLIDLNIRCRIFLNSSY